MRTTELNFVTTPYGKPGSWAAGYHTGIDYRAATGDPIFASRGGKVVHAGWGGRGEAYGNHVVIQSWFRGRRRQHLYAHLSKNLVEVGDKVRVGHKIGLAGETGNAFGSHLHYEERNAPFGYWDHYQPIMVAWVPPSAARAKKILTKILGR